MIRAPSPLVRFRLPKPGRASPCGLTIGSFDGVHLGHQAILRELIDRCSERGLTSSVLTFYPRPAQFFAPGKAAPSLMGWREKVGTLMQMGVEQIVCLPFDRHISELSAESFVQRMVVSGLNAKLVMIGDDFRFGNDRQGDYESLRALGSRYNFSVMHSPTVEFGGKRVSSSRIRAELSRGNLVGARNLLGRDYAIQGRVITGRQLGRQLGVPTANIAVSRDRLVMTGVFVVRVDLGDGRGCFGVGNLGFRPAVEASDQPLLEVHLLDFDENLYGRRLCVQFLYRMRDEQRFASHRELERQIKLDIAGAREWLLKYEDRLEPND